MLSFDRELEKTYDAKPYQPQHPHKYAKRAENFYQCHRAKWLVPNASGENRIENEIGGHACQDDSKRAENFPAYNKKAGLKWDWLAKFVVGEPHSRTLAVKKFPSTQFVSIVSLRGKLPDIKMKIRIAVACMLFSVSVATAQTAKDFDFECAVVASAELATTQKGTPERHRAFSVFAFYLGRLSARDDTTYWGAAIKGRIAELREKARSPDLFGDCADFIRKKLE